MTRTDAHLHARVEVARRFLLDQGMDEKLIELDRRHNLSWRLLVEMLELMQRLGASTADMGLVLRARPE